mmetsp:Transcript_44880/g.116289  ORF Transcript_44880/g.116289 Transcript_44880/m.116289 type:complete len:220 (+) Transcript_44880:629-1288(+)
MQAAQRHPRQQVRPGRVHGGGGEPEPRQREPRRGRLRGGRLQQHHLQPRHRRRDPRAEGPRVAAQGRGHVHPAAADHHLGPGLPRLHGPVPEGRPPGLLPEARRRRRRQEGDGGGRVGDHRLRHRPLMGGGAAAVPVPRLPRHGRLPDPHGLPQRAAPRGPERLRGCAVAQLGLGRRRAGGHAGRGLMRRKDGRRRREVRPVPGPHGRAGIAMLPWSTV